MEDTPRSKSTASTAASLRSARTSGISSYTAWTAVNRSLERREALRGELEGFRVAVDADHPGALAVLEDTWCGRPGRGRNHDRAVVVEGGRQKCDDPVERTGTWRGLLMLAVLTDPGW